MLMTVNAILREPGLPFPNLCHQPMKQQGLQAGLIRLRRKEGGRPLAQTPSRPLRPELEEGGGKREEGRGRREEGGERLGELE